MTNRGLKARLIPPIEPNPHFIYHQPIRRKTMSAHESKSWIDTWWPLLVILFGVLFISTLVFFHPHF